MEQYKLGQNDIQNVECIKLPLTMQVYNLVLEDSPYW